LKISWGGRALKNPFRGVEVTNTRWRRTMSAGRITMKGDGFAGRGRGVGFNPRRLLAIALVVALTIATAYAGVARAGTGPEAAAGPMGAEAETIHGEGLLSCGNAVVGGILLTASMGFVGAFFGGFLIACGCDDELDGMFNTNFTTACS
jgi:hypothetical protein